MATESNDLTLSAAIRKGIELTPAQCYMSYYYVSDEGEPESCVWGAACVGRHGSLPDENFDILEVIETFDEASGATMFPDDLMRAFADEDIPLPHHATFFKALVYANDTLYIPREKIADILEANGY